MDNNDKKKFSFALVLVALLACGFYLAMDLMRSPPPPAPVTPEPVPEEPKPEPEEPEEEDLTGKQAFIDTLLPVIQSHNREILAKRTKLHDVGAGLLALDALAEPDFDWLKALAAEYKLDPARRSNNSFFSQLESRIDVVPASIIIAQAAIETNWGESTNARETNNWFGLKCFDKGCGRKPETPPLAGYYEVIVFQSLDEAVEAHMLELNTHFGYKTFRDIRQGMREDGTNLNGSVMADGLAEYHDFGQLHSQEVEEIIREHRLDDLKNL